MFIYSNLLNTALTNISKDLPDDFWPEPSEQLKDQKQNSAILSTLNLNIWFVRLQQQFQQLTSVYVLHTDVLSWTDNRSSGWVDPCTGPAHHV